MSERIAKGAAPGTSPGARALAALPATGRGLAGPKKEVGMPTNYGYKPSRGAKRFDRQKGFKAARKERLRNLEGKARRAREQIRQLGIKE